MRITPRRALLPPLLVALAWATGASAAGTKASGDDDAFVITLDQALEQSLASNLDVRSARQDALVSQTGVTRSLGVFNPVASFFYQHSKDISPQASELDALLSQSISDVWRAAYDKKLHHGGTYQLRLDGSRRESNNPFLRANPTYSVDATFIYTLPLLRGFGRDSNLAALRQAENDAAISRDAFRMQARDVVKSTIDAYWDLLFSIQDLGVKEQAHDLAKELERKNEIMVRVGTLAQLEIVQARASVAERYQEIIAAEAAVAAAEDGLRRQMGVAEGSPWWERSLVPAEQMPPEPRAADLEIDERQREIVDEALERRLEVGMAERRVDNADIQLGSARDSWLPQLDWSVEVSTAGLGGDLTEEIDTDGDTVPDTFVRVSDQDFGKPFEEIADRDFNSWRTSLNLTYPIRNRAAKASLTSARLGLEKQRIELEKARQQVILEVRSAVRQVHTTAQQVLASRTSRDLQLEKLEAEVRKFENGLSTNFEVLQFQTDLTQAESRVLLAGVEHAKALAALDRARGRLLPPSEDELLN